MYIHYHYIEPGYLYVHVETERTKRRSRVVVDADDGEVRVYHDNSDDPSVRMTLEHDDPRAIDLLSRVLEIYQRTDEQRESPLSGADVVEALSWYEEDMIETLRDYREAMNRND